MINFLHSRLNFLDHSLLNQIFNNIILVLNLLQILNHKKIQKLRKINLKMIKVLKKREKTKILMRPKKRKMNLY